MSAVEGSPAAILPELRPLAHRHLLVVATGSISVSFLPYWVNWMRVALPDTAVRLVLSTTAQRFVSAEALAGLRGAAVEFDRWDSEERAPADGGLHVDLADWAQAVLVHPCTLSFMARLASGAADSPAMLALQCIRAPIVVSPSLPPGAEDSWAYNHHRDALSERGMVVTKPVPGRSAATGRLEASAPAHFPDAVAALAARVGSDDVARA